MHTAISYAGRGAATVYALNLHQFFQAFITDALTVFPVGEVTVHAAVDTLLYAIFIFVKTIIAD